MNRVLDLVVAREAECLSRALLKKVFVISPMRIMTPGAGLLGDRFMYHRIVLDAVTQLIMANDTCRIDLVFWDGLNGWMFCREVCAPFAGHVTNGAAFCFDLSMQKSVLRYFRVALGSCTVCFSLCVCWRTRKYQADDKEGAGEFHQTPFAP